MSVDDVVDRRLFQLPLAGISVVAGQGEAMPVQIVQLHVITPVVVSRPPRFLRNSVCWVTDSEVNSAMVQLPRALKLVQVLGAHMVQVFS